MINAKADISHFRSDPNQLMSGVAVSAGRFACTKLDRRNSHHSIHEFPARARAFMRASTLRQKD
jgi:hypothetical protein